MKHPAVIPAIADVVTVASIATGAGCVRLTGLTPGARLPHLPHLPRLVPFIAGAVLAGCSSTPVRYYTLTALPGSVVAAGSLAPVRVGRVSIPTEIDRGGLMYHLGPDQLYVADSDLWAAPLSDLIRNAVTRDLGQRLGYTHVVSPNSGPAPGGETTLALDFSSLSADEKCNVSGRIYWSFAAPKETLQHGTLDLSQAVGACPAGLPAALTQLLGRLSDELAPRLAAAARAPQAPAAGTPTASAR